MAVVCSIVAVVHSPIETALTSRVKPVLKSCGASFPGEAPFLLLPTSPTRFRPQGLPAGYAMVFEKGEGGSATALTLSKPGVPDTRMTRQP